MNGKQMKQLARMQQQMAEVQNTVMSMTAEATTGGGAVKAVAKGDGSLVSIKIDPQVLAAGDASMLEDMVLLASNQALAKVRDAANAEMSKVTSGLGIPGLM